MVFTCLLLLVPLSLGLAYFHSPPLWVFAAAAAIISLAEWARRVTGKIAEHAGPVISALLTVTLSVRGKIQIDL
jgi:Ca2+/H+ antiporter